jgi:hypothetical protein
VKSASFDDRELRKRFAALRSGEASRLILGQFGELTVQYARQNAHRFKKTGNLERSIRVLEIDVKAQTVSVGAGGTRLIRNATTGGFINSGYAAHVEYGTKPHIIRPRRKKVLFFASEYALAANRRQLSGTGLAPRGKIRRRLSGSATNATVRRFGTLAFQYATFVKHPGTRAQPYLIPAASEALRRVGLAEQVVRAWNDAA